MEIFKTIPQFEDYEVSNYGRVRTKSRKVRFVHSVTGSEHFRLTEHRLLKVYFNKRTGYNMVQPYKNKKMHNLTIHKAVALAFIENPNKYEVVNHKDGDKLNNIVENLEWCTSEYNHIHAKENGLLAKGSDIGTSKLNKRCVLAIKKLLEYGVTHEKLSVAFDVSRTCITHISLNKTWKHITP